MSTTNFPNGVSSFGVPVLGGSILTTGNIFFVDSGAANATDNPNRGSKDEPFATIDYAVGRCTANNGDHIIVMPGHAETVAAASGIDFDVAGITVLGIGRGAARPTITLSATGSTVEVAAASVTIDNLLLTTSAAATIMVDVNAADCTIQNCEFRMLTGVTAIDVDGGSANVCDRTMILNNIFDGSTDGPDEAIHLNEVADSVVIAGNYAYGLFDDACIHNPTGSVLTWLQIYGNVLVNGTAASHSIELVSACTGVIAENRMGNPLDDVTNTGLDGGACYMLQNYGHDGTADASGTLSPIADA